MAVASVTMKPYVVKLGGAVEDRHSYTTGGVDTIAAGDLIRINAAGTIDLAEAASAGAFHGIALEGDSGSAKQIPVLLFAADTVIAIQAQDTKTPADFPLSDSFALEISGNTVGLNDTATNAVVQAVGYAYTGTPWHDVTGTYTQASTTANGIVYVKPLQATLEGSAAAAS
jgi:hypothetical protein